MNVRRKVMSIGLAMVFLSSVSITHASRTEDRSISSREYIQEDYVELQSSVDVQEVSSNQVTTVYTYNELKSEMQKNLKNRNAQFRIDYEGSLLNASNISRAAYEDIKKEDHYLSGHMAGIQWSTSSLGDKHRIEISASYTSTREQEIFVDAEVDRVVSSIIRAGMTDFQKIKAINDYIVLNTEYSTSAGVGVSQHSAYAVLKEGQGVCSGYALAALSLMERVGIEAQYITGYAGENHGWNLVKLDGQWYHMDTTWNDPTPNRPGVVSYEYFLVPDSYIATTHSWNRGDFPSARSTKYSWMNEIASANLVGSKIYYSSIGDNYRLYSINEDGTGKRKLTDNMAPYLAVVGNTIYFSDYSRGGNIYSMNIDGSHVKQINTKYTRDLYVDGSKLYFTNVGTGGKESIDIKVDTVVPDKPTDGPSLIGVSPWAEREIRGAFDKGLTVDRLLSSFQRNITREEFAELSVKLYEALSGKLATPASLDTFTDTKNLEILKANKLGIIEGVGGRRFAPNDNVTREQIAVMFYRTIEAVDAGLVRGNFVPTFADRNEISTWARREVAFMNSRGLLQGVGGNRVDPKGSASREQAMILSYRTFNSYK